MSIISCVLLVSADDLEQATRVINNLGYPGENFTVELLKPSNSEQWFGLHMWADDDFVDYMTELDPAIQSLVMSSVLNGNALENWRSSLASAGLILLP